MHCPACSAKYPSTSNDITVHPFLHRKPTRKVENAITEAVHIVNNRPKHALENDQTIMLPHSAASMVNHIPTGSPYYKTLSRQRSGPVPAATAAASLVNAHVIATPVAVKRQTKPAVLSTSHTSLASPRPFYPPGFGASRGPQVATPSRLSMRNSPPRTEVSILAKEKMMNTPKANDAVVKVITAEVKPTDISRVTKAVSRVLAPVRTSVVSSPPNTVRRMIDTRRSMNVTPMSSRDGDMKISNVEVLKNKNNIPVSQKTSGITKHGKRDGQIKGKVEHIARSQACAKISLDVKAAADPTVTRSGISVNKINGTTHGKKENEVREMKRDGKKVTTRRTPGGEKTDRARNIRGGVSIVATLSCDEKKRQQVLARVGDNKTAKKIETKDAQSVRGGSPTIITSNPPFRKGSFVFVPRNNREPESCATTRRDAKSVCRLELGVEDPINMIYGGGYEGRKAASPCGESTRHTGDITGDTTSVASLLDETLGCAPHQAGKPCIEKNSTGDASATSAACILDDITAVSSDPGSGQDISKLQCPIELGDIHPSVEVKQALVRAPAFAPSKGICQIVGTILAFVAADIAKEHASAQSAVPAACIVIPAFPVNDDNKPCATKEVRKDLRRILDVETQRMQQTQAALDKLEKFLDSNKTTEESVGVKRLHGCDAFLEKSKELHGYLDGVVSIIERFSSTTVPGFSPPARKEAQKTSESLIEEAETPSRRLACELAEQAKVRTKALEHQFNAIGEEENDYRAVTLPWAPKGGQATPALEKVQPLSRPGSSTPSPGTPGRFTISALRRTPASPKSASSADEADEQEMNPMKRRYLDWSARKLYEQQIASGTPTRTVSAAAACSKEGELPRLSIACHAGGRFSLPHPATCSL